MRSRVEQVGPCPRCHGYIVSVNVDGSEEGMLNEREAIGWRCINCGEQIDPLIMANRRAADRMDTMTHPRRA